MNPFSLAPVLTPHGRLRIETSEDAPVLDGPVARRLLRAFSRGSGHGLLQLGADEAGTPLSPALAFWRELGIRYVAALCVLPQASDTSRKEAVLSPPPASWIPWCFPRRLCWARNT